MKCPIIWFLALLCMYVIVAAKSNPSIFSKIFPRLHVLCVAIVNAVILFLVYKWTLYTRLNSKTKADAVVAQLPVEKFIRNIINWTVI